MRNRLLLVIVFVGLFLAGLSYGIQQWVLLPSFYQLEQELAAKDLNRVIDAINREADHLTNIATAYSSWLDTYQFAQDENKAYIDNNFGREVMKKIINVHLFQIYNRNGEQIKSDIFSSYYQDKLDLSLFSKKNLPLSHLFLQHKINSSLQGIVLTEQGPMIITALPILDNYGSGPVNGTLIMGSFIRHQTIRSLVNPPPVNFFLVPAIMKQTSDINKEDRLATIGEKIGEKEKIITKNEKLLIVHGLISDVFNQPGLMVHANIPRDVTMRGQDASKLASMTILLSLMILSLTLLGLFVIYNTRLKKINQGIKKEVDYRTFQLRLAKDDAEQAQDEAETSKEQAIQANRARGDFLANMSHEIRTPMNAILGMSYLCQRTPLSSKQARYIDNIHHTASSLLGLLNSILDFSKIDSGKMELDIIDFVLDDGLSYLDRLTFEQVREKKVPLIFDIQAKLPFMLKGDLLRLGQIALNLVQNSLKFTEQGVIYLKIKKIAEDDTQVHLEMIIEDTGIGMSQESAEHIFDEFVQADRSTTRRYGGTGLGLSISRQLVLLMGGQINLSSQQGKGTKVCVEVSFNKSSRSSYEVSEALTGTNIMIISADTKFALAISHTLTSYGGKIKSYTDLISALPDVIGKIIILIDDHFSKKSIAEFLGSITQINNKTTNILLTNQAEIPKTFSSYKLAILSKAVHLNNFCQAAIIGSASKAITTKKAKHKKKILSIEETLRGRTVLLAEDNTMNRQLVIELLSDVGIKVISAENGQQAIELLNQCQHKVDAILMDIQMPVMDGMEATKKIRQQGQWQTIPIIALTASAMQGDKEKGLAMGMNDYLTKPIFADKLYQSLLHWCAGNNDADKIKYNTKNNHQPIAKSAHYVSKLKDNFLILPTGSAVNNAPDKTRINNLVLDIDAGLKVCAGKKPLLESLWRQFAEKHALCVENIMVSLQEQDIKKASALLHNLKGIAGSIGALTLSKQADELNQQLKVNDTVIKEEQLQKMAAQLALVLESINKTNLNN